MDELRELILAQLEELHCTGLSDERYQLYVDMVYQCDSMERLIDMAALELQMEAHEFLSQLAEQVPEDFDEEDSDRDDVEQFNSDGFGDGFEDEADFGAGMESVHTDEDDIDPAVLAMQQALMGGNEDINDPDYFDIDALLAKGSAPDIPTKTVVYNDSLAKLLSAYDTKEDEQEEVLFDDPSQLSSPANNGGFGGFGSQLPPAPSGFGAPSGGFGTTQPAFGKAPAQGGFAPAQHQAGFGKPAGFGNATPPALGKPAVQQAPKPAQPAPKPAQPVAQPKPAQPAKSTAKSFFADFSKRKTK